MLPRSTRGRSQSLSQTGWGVAVYPQVGVYAAGLLASHCWRGVGVGEGVRLAIPVAHSWGSLLGRQQGIASVTFHSTAWSWQQLLPPREGSRTPLQPPTVPFCSVRCRHTSALQKAAGGAVLLPTPFLCSKSKSLFLRSAGCRPAVRQPDGKARGLSSLPGSLAAGGPSASRGLPLELCQALRAHCYGLELSSAACEWLIVFQPCPGARCWVEGVSLCPHLAVPAMSSPGAPCSPVPG